jgi:hypothetical protein
MRLSSSAIGRPNKRLLVLILIVVAFTLSSIACQNSAGAANVVWIKAPNGGGEGFDWNSTGSLVVKLKPNSTTESNTQYTVDLYEKGKLRDTSYVSWSAPDFNMKNPEYVYFPLSNTEFEAYSKGRMPTRDEFLKASYAYIYKDLQGTFSVKVYEETDEP